MLLKKKTTFEQHGSALIISLVFLLLLAVIGVGAMQSATLQERMAGNVRDYNAAFQGAEAGLRAGEAALSVATTLPTFNGSQAGYVQPLTNPGNTAYWESYNWANSSAVSTTNLSSGGISNNPQYVIEQFPVTVCDEDVSADFSVGKGGQRAAKAASDCQVYRTTSKAQGDTGSSVVIMQSTFKRRVASGS